MNKWGPVVEAGAAAAGMCVFALFAHSKGTLAVLSVAGLAVTGVAVARFAWTERAPFELVGWNLLSRKAAAFAGEGALLGLGLGVFYRYQYGWPLFPGALTGFAFVAASVGATEEFLYRGYVQGRARRWGIVGAVVFAAACHTAYKCLLFALPPVPVEMNFWALAAITFFGGMGFGALRELSGSVFPALLAHGCFDIIVYGGYSQAPWWVWA